MLYEFLVSIVEADTKAQLQALAASVLNYVVAEADPDNPGQKLYFLGFGGAKLRAGTTPKGQPIFYQLGAHVGYNADESHAVSAVLANWSDYANEHEYMAPFKTRAQIDADLLYYAGADGARGYWTIHPGDDLSAADAPSLLAKFLPLNGG